MYKGYIIAPIHQKEYLDSLGVTYDEPYKYGDGGVNYMFPNCHVPNDCLLKLDKHYGAMAFALEPK